MEELLDEKKLEMKIKEMYHKVALFPFQSYHIEIGRTLAEKLGYLPQDLDKIPKEAVESFAGVGNPFDYADIKEGEVVLDLGSGSGMDSFIAAMKTGKSGKVYGVDITVTQLDNAEKARNLIKINNIEFHEANISSLPFEDDSIDVIISNNVINLSPEKLDVFKEISRVLKRNGRLAVSDVLSERKLGKKVKNDADLWAACVAGAADQNEYRRIIDQVGMEVIDIHENPEYQFRSESAIAASREFGVKSVTYLAKKR
ncbi:MAG: methyltransferase domain-containing protein [Candidatus Thorarchaeota archaeon]